MGKKYELLSDDTITIDGRTLYRIRALRTFAGVEVGSLGGYIENEFSLSHEGSCWVGGNAAVGDIGCVRDGASVLDNARLRRAYAGGYAVISANAQVCGHTHISGNARVGLNARIHSNDAVVWFSNVGSEYVTLTIYCSKDGLRATSGCFDGTLDEFCAANASRPSNLNSERIKREYELLVEMARLRLGTAQRAVFEMEGALND